MFAYPGMHLAGGRYRLRHRASVTSPTHLFTVWEADDLAGSGLVIIKHINQSARLSRVAWETAHTLLCREAAFLRRIAHPHIASLFDFFNEGGYLHLVIQYLPGQTLSKYLNVGKSGWGRSRICSQAEAIDFGIQCYGILAYVHSLVPSIIHRDIKPANIRRLPDGAYALFDFGNARENGYRAISASGPPWRGLYGDTFAGIGSIGYAPPEQYPGRRPAHTTIRSDLYSVASIMHQMLSGEDPSKKGRRRRFVYSPLEGRADTALAALIRQTLSFAPSRRPASATDIIARLQAIKATGASGKADTWALTERA